MTEGSDPARPADVRDLLSLRGRIALIAGGAGRYGQHISAALAEAGATVLIASRDRTRCQRLVAALAAEGHEAHALELDLTCDESTEKAADGIREKFGKLDVFVNSAVTISTGPLDRYSVEEWQRVMDMNSTGVFRGAKVFGGLMVPRRAGSIIHVGSIYGVVSPDFSIYEGHPDMTNPPSYGFVKAGMIQLTRYLAVSYARHGIRVNCLSPGGLYSPQMPADFVARYCRHTPLGRLAGPNDIKGAAVFLASDASAYITGHNLMVDGGYTAL